MTSDPRPKPTNTNAETAGRAPAAPTSTEARRLYRSDTKADDHRIVFTDWASI